jgi:hypothetical protein
MKKSLLLCAAGLIAIGMSGCTTYDNGGLFYDDYDYGPGYDVGYYDHGYGGHHRGHHHR